MDKTIDRWTDPDGNGYAFKDTVARAQNRATIDKMNTETADRKSELDIERKRIDNLIQELPATAGEYQQSKLVLHSYDNTAVKCTTTSGNYTNVPAFTTDQGGPLSYLYTKKSNYQIAVNKSGLYLFELRIHVNSLIANKRVELAPFVNDTRIAALASSYNTAGSFTLTRIAALPLWLSANDTVDFKIAPIDAAEVSLQLGDVLVYAIDWEDKFKIPDYTGYAAETKDIRTGADGTVYGTAGEAVRKQIGNLTEDITEISDVVLFHSSDVKDTTRVPINLKTGTKIRIRRKDGKDFTKNNRVKFWKEDGSTNITYFSIEPSFGKERVIVYTYADASYVSLNIADTDIVVDVYADDTLAEIVKNQESIVSQVKNDIFYDFIDLIGTTRLVFPFVKNDTIIIERVDGKDFEGSNRLMLYGEDNAYIDYYSLAPSFGNKRVITYAKNNPVKYIALNSASTYAIRVTLQSDGKLIRQVADNTNRIIALETEIHATIADRFVSEMNETIASVRNCMTEPCLVFPKITDIHYAPTSTVFQNFDETIKNMKYFVERIHCDFIANLGDNINGSSNVETSLSQADHMLSAFNGIGIPYLFAVGNHDTNYDPSPKFDIGQTYRAFMSATPKNAIINKATNGTDFYVDFDGLEIRVVFINTNYLGAYVLAEDTKNWFINTVLNTDKLVVLCEHMSTQANQNFSNKIPSKTRSEAINNAISTFISNGGKFIQLFGHSHCDYAFTSPWLSIASTCGKFEQEDINSESIRAITGYETTYGLVSPSRTEGNATEQAWDVVVIRPTSRKINLIRFGAGVDREFSY